MKEGDLLLQADLGGSLHLSPGKFKGRNFYLRTIPTLLVRCRQHCHCTETQHEMKQQDILDGNITPPPPRTEQNLKL